MKPSRVAIVYDFDGTLAPGNMAALPLAAQQISIDFGAQIGVPICVGIT